MKTKQAILATALSLSLVAAGVNHTAAHSTRTDKRCQAIYNINRGNPNLDWIENYVGCDEVYRNGTLIGFRKGDTKCERAAYRGALVKRLTGSEFHAYMGKNDCVLYEDWSWGAE